MKYNVGDKVRIKSLDWYNENKDERGYIACGHHVFTKYMSTFCGCTMIVCNRTNLGVMTMYGNTCYWTDKMIEGLAEEMPLDKAGQITDFEYDGLSYTLPDGYQFVDENGNVINATKIVLEKKRKEYPKTFEECCKILGLLNVDLCFNADYRSFEASKEQWKRLGLMNQFYQLLICRDAYWKIAGEEMRLGNSWKPRWNDGYQKKYCIYNDRDDIQKGDWHFTNSILAFPTEEMRDEFYENFKEEIEICKELL